MNEAPARRRGPGERVNAELKNWKIRQPDNADKLIAAARTLMIASA